MTILGELSKLAGAQLIGDPDTEITDAKTTMRASFGDITFAKNDKNLQAFLASDAVAVVISSEVYHAHTSTSAKAFLVVENVDRAFENIVAQFRPIGSQQEISISDRANVSETAQVGDKVQIFPGASIGDNVKIGNGVTIHPNVTIMDNSIIGDNTTVFPNVVIYENTAIGSRCIIHGGAIIGAYGFGYRSGTTHELSAQLGNVEIGNDVEIGGNTCIDRGTYDSTLIGDGTKIDDLVMIGHNCTIGKHNLLCSQVGIAGSTTTGDHVVMAGQVGVGDHLEIGDKATLAAQSGVMHNLPGDKVYFGSPATPIRDQLQSISIVNKLPAMKKQLRSLQKLVEQISESQNRTGMESAHEAA